MFPPFVYGLGTVSCSVVDVGDDTSESVADSSEGSVEGVEGGVREDCCHWSWNVSAGQGSVAGRALADSKKSVGRSSDQGNRSKHHSHPGLSLTQILNST